MPKKQRKVRRELSRMFDWPYRKELIMLDEQGNIVKKSSLGQWIESCKKHPWKGKIVDFEGKEWKVGDFVNALRQEQEAQISFHTQHIYSEQAEKRENRAKRIAQSTSPESRVSKKIRDAFRGDAPLVMVAEQDPLDPNLITMHEVHPSGKYNYALQQRDLRLRALGASRKSRPREFKKHKR